MEKDNPKVTDISTMLREYYLRGCSLSVNGKAAMPWEVEEACLRERSNYMMDFTSEPGSDRITHIDFTHVIDDEPDDRISSEPYVGWCS